MRDYPSWDKFVRAPLIRAGYADVMDLFERNHDNSPEHAAKEAILSNLHALTHSTTWLRGTQEACAAQVFCWHEGWSGFAT
jgi:hypothetical protein